MPKGLGELIASKGNKTESNNSKPESVVELHRLAAIGLPSGCGPHGNSAVGLSNPLESRGLQSLNSFETAS
jgi:hypothetical protein